YDGMTKNQNVASSSANLANIGFQWLLSASLGSLPFYMQLTTNGLWATNFLGNGSGLVHASSSNLEAEARGQVTNIISALSPNTSSNALLFAGKLDATNGFGTGDVLTNLALEGNVSFGRDGQATNILSGTNYLYFVGAGSGLATNGAFIWYSSLNCYSNWNGAILTNNSTAWLLQTNGVTLYSLSGSNPIGAYSAVSGALPAPASYYTAGLNDHMPIFGVNSWTNILAQIIAATNSQMAVITNGTGTGSIAVVNGFGTNTTLRFATAQWGYLNSVGGSSFSAALAGSSNSVALGAGNIIAGGQNNSVGNSTGNGILGGTWNSIGSGGGFSVINGGTSNRIDLNTSYGVIGGGFS